MNHCHPANASNYFDSFPSGQFWNISITQPKQHIPCKCKSYPTIMENWMPNTAFMVCQNSHKWIWEVEHELWLRNKAVCNSLQNPNLCQNLAVHVVMVDCVSDAYSRMLSKLPLLLSLSFSSSVAYGSSTHWGSNQRNWLRNNIIVSAS